ncbi:hypothetical protein [Streptomyces sp. NPDC058045]|uniref:hypothetical protein n=1 Tax=Streptomyces sp. NPDC058045 TaxID=3346311 RepID=UPI0036EDD9E3
MRTARLLTGPLLAAAGAALSAALSAAPAHAAPAHTTTGPATPAHRPPAHPPAAAHPATATATAPAPAHRATAPVDGAPRLDLVPSPAAPGGGVSAGTTACGSTGAAGDASAVGAGRFTLAPGAGAPEGGGVGGFEVPPSAQPGTYRIVARCADGREVHGDLVVSLPAGEGARPHGHVKTGVGGALGPDPGRTAAGVAALAVAAAGGTWLLHRRARGDGV